MGATKMIVLNTKTFEELSAEGISALNSIGFNSSPGSIAKLFLNIVNSNIADLYTTLSVNHLRAFVTTADNDALDAIGSLLQCYRLKNESDDNYRYRITNQCLTLATSNYTAVRLTALTTDDVEDVVLQEYSMGAGSFTVIVITNSDVTPQEVLERVDARLKDVHGYGIRYNVVSPTLNYIKLTQQLYFTDNVSDIEKQDIRYSVQQVIMDYLANLKIGEMFNIDKMTQLIMNVSPYITQEQNRSFYINNEKALYTNQTSKWFERFTLSNDVDNVVVL
jgi:uncharacterized phage protein gp47/JayE